MKRTYTCSSGNFWTVQDGTFFDELLRAPEYPVRAFPNFYVNSRRYSKVKVNHQGPQHRQFFLTKICNGLKGTLRGLVKTDS
jgi:hypothetical protein